MNDARSLFPSRERTFWRSSGKEYTSFAGWNCDDEGVGEPGFLMTWTDTILGGGDVDIVLMKVRGKGKKNTIQDATFLVSQLGDRAVNSKLGPPAP